MRSTHKYAKRVSSTYVFSDSEILQALGKLFDMPGWVDADYSKRLFEYDDTRHELTVVIHYDQPVETTLP